MNLRPIEQFKQRLAIGLGRRSALIAASGFAALPLVAAAQDDDELSAAARRRGRRGPRGKRGKTGPPAGANLVLVSEPCSVADSDVNTVGQTHVCTAACDAGYAATGGGYEGAPLLQDLAIIQSNQPLVDGGEIVGWEITVEFLNVGQGLDYTAYAICAPTGS